MLLLVHAVVLLRLMVGSFAILLSWVSDISTSTLPISLDNRETSPNVEQVGSSTLLHENRESGR